MALVNAKSDVTEDRLASLTLPSGAKWANEVRDDALARLRAVGLATPRDEYWRYTNPQTLNQPEVLPAAIFVADEPEVFGEIDRLKIVFVDGVFDADASDSLEMAGLEIELLADVMSHDIHWAKDLYARLEVNGQTPVSRPLATLNSAFSNTGIVIRATGKAEKPVALIYLHRSETSDALLHHLIKVEEGASLTVLENGPAAARFNKVLEVEIADHATFRHIRTQGRDHERRAVTHIFAQLGTESTFKSFTMTANGVMTRNEVVIELLGDNSIAHVAGAALGDGDFHHDDTVFITHKGLACESRQVFKKVLRNGAVGVFQGKILVHSEAQKTDGYQISQALLLDGASVYQAKPELEIYADDVICSHGSTTGAIDETAMFYLRSRGVSESEAQDLLVLAFLSEAIQEIDDEDIAEDVNRRLQSWLERRQH
ncbi:MAG: Fe-S cluster assembly protein SufD [Paracoccaceae bacterium]